MTTISILGIPLDLGAGRRGVDMGPSALRLAGLAKSLTMLGHTVFDYGNVQMPVAEALVSSNGLHYARDYRRNVPSGIFRADPGSQRGLSYRVRRRPFGFAGQCRGRRTSRAHRRDLG